MKTRLEQHIQHRQATRKRRLASLMLALMMLLSIVLPALPVAADNLIGDDPFTLNIKLVEVDSNWQPIGYAPSDILDLYQFLLHYSNVKSNYDARYLLEEVDEGHFAIELYGNTSVWLRADIHYPWSFTGEWSAQPSEDEGFFADWPMSHSGLDIMLDLFTPFADSELRLYVKAGPEQPPVGQGIRFEILSEVPHGESATVAAVPSGVLPIRYSASTDEREYITFIAVILNDNEPRVIHDVDSILHSSSRTASVEDSTRLSLRWGENRIRFIVRDSAGNELVYEIDSVPYVPTTVHMVRAPRSSKLETLPDGTHYYRDRLMVCVHRGTTFEQLNAVIGMVNGEIIGVSGLTFTVSIPTSTYEEIRIMSQALQSAYPQLIERAEPFWYIDDWYGDIPSDTATNQIALAREVEASDYFPTDEGERWWSNHEWGLGSTRVVDVWRYHGHRIQEVKVGVASAAFMY